MAQATLIHDTTIVTADDAGTILYDAALVVSDGRIAALGPTPELLTRYPNAERVDGRGRAILPGLANTHTHLSRVLARGIYEDLSPPHTPPFTGGLAPLPLPELTPEEERVMAVLGALEAIRSGTTLVLEESAGLAGYAGALADTGLRLVLCERAWDRANASIGQPGPFQVDPALAERGLARIAEFHARWHGQGDGRVQAGLAAWAPDLCSPGLLGRLRKLQSELGAIATVHLNQVWGEVAAVTEQRGLSPTEYLAREGFLSDRLVAAHCRCMTPQEEQVLGGFRAAVAFNSAIAARRGLSPRADDLERAGCLITLGTDNMAEDMIEVMRTALFMERVRRQDGRRPTPEEVLVWASRNGYRALGIPDGGWLAPGNRADIILIDLRKPHLTPALRVVSCFVHQGLPSDVEAVMVDGRWIMREGRVLTMDEAAIVADGERIARAAWRRLFERRPDLSRPPGLDLGTR
jgi:cytosine/adenosine deaminase-related metal-dependent hydrolase